MFEFYCNFFPLFSARKTRKEGEVLIVFTNSLDLLYLNETAALFCALADGHRTLGEVVNVIKREYDVDSSRLVADICHLIRDLQWKDVLTFSKHSV